MPSGRRVMRRARTGFRSQFGASRGLISEFAKHRPEFVGIGRAHEQSGAVPKFAQCRYVAEYEGAAG